MQHQICLRQRGTRGDDISNILVKIPKGSFAAEHRTTLVRRLNDAAACAEQIPDDPKKRALCWVVVDEVEPGAWTCGAVDVTAQVLPCIVMVYLPAGVLDGAWGVNGTVWRLPNFAKAAGLAHLQTLVSASQ
jgi:phenylpyruvate tautomerase PptA (4-oxalocrotonate tautomerase family)